MSRRLSAIDFKPLDEFTFHQFVRLEYHSPRIGKEMSLAKELRRSLSSKDRRIFDRMSIVDLIRLLEDYMALNEASLILRMERHNARNNGDHPDQSS